MPLPVVPVFPPPDVGDAVVVVVVVVVVVGVPSGGLVWGALWLAGLAGVGVLTVVLIGLATM